MEQLEEEEEKRGVADWMTTYADLMSLLMCFFVLLLSFSEMDVAKYKQIAGSMKEAFGVQNQVRVKDIPKGTSVIKQEFTPGRTTPSLIKTVQQQTTQTSTQLDLRVEAPPGESVKVQKLEMPAEAAKRIIEETQYRETEEVAEELKQKLEIEIEQGKIEIEYDRDSITVRIRERGSFPSGSADLADEFMPIVPILQQALKDITGEIAVEGHTDNIPIYNARFRSNWALSSARALALMHELIEDPALDPRRFKVIGFADTRPRASNDTWENRAQNRRVEIVIRRSVGPPEQIF